MESPSTKVTTFAVAAAITAVIVWALEAFGHVHVPDEIQTAIVIVVGFVLAYLVPETNPPSSAKEHLDP